MILELRESLNFQLLVQGTQKELNHSDKGIFNDEVLGHLKRPEVVVKAISEEGMNNVEVALVICIVGTSCWFISHRGLYHRVCHKV